MNGANHASLLFLSMRPHSAALPHSADLVHVAAIREIADELGQPYEEVDALYRYLFDVFSAQASVTHFLSVLVSRKVREHYRGASAPGP